jgi:DNA polymerase-3 subunit alpha
MDPALEKILKRTNGILVYQDDLLTIAHDLAGYTWEEVDKFRKAVGKKIPAEMAKQKEKFIQGCMKTSGWSKEKAEKIWLWIEPFAAYGFNKSHSASYSVVSYQTAFMKANYPVEYMAAVMTAEAGDMPTIADAVGECGIMGIEVLPPDVNESLANFTVIDESHIRFGLAAIKNLGSDVVEITINQRKANGKFASMEDFVRRVQTKNFNKKSWEAMAKSGALDSLGERSQLLANTEAVLEFARGQFKETSQSSLFDANMIPETKLKMRSVPKATKRERLAWEKELLGLYVSSHPLEDFMHKLKFLAMPIKEIIAAQPKTATVGGIITRVQKILTKKGEPMAFVDVEDTTGTLEIVVFPSVYSLCRDLITEEKMVLVTGKLSDKDGETKILADNIKELTASDLSKEVSVTIKVPENANDQLFEELKKLFESSPGEISVNLMVNQQKIATPFKIDLTEDLKTKIKELLAA